MPNRFLTHDLDLPGQIPDLYDLAQVDGCNPYGLQDSWHVSLVGSVLLKHTDPAQRSQKGRSRSR